MGIRRPRREAHGLGSDRDDDVVGDEQLLEDLLALDGFVVLQNDPAVVGEIGLGDPALDEHRENQEHENPRHRRTGTAEPEERDE